MFEGSSTDSPALKVGIAHAAAPERLEALRELVEHVRPHAQIEIATQLGAVRRHARRARHGRLLLVRGPL